MGVFPAHLCEYENDLNVDREFLSDKKLLTFREIEMNAVIQARVDMPTSMEFVTQINVENSTFIMKIVPKVIFPVRKGADREGLQFVVPAERYSKAD